MTNEIILAIEKIIRKKGHCMVCIDGRCGAGKSTLAKAIENRIDCNVVHMDDFFLPKEERRKNELGGNIDYKRLKKEVVSPFEKGEGISYRPFSCKNGAFLNEVTLERKSVTIIEGSYSCNKTLFEKCDLHVFVDVHKEVQIERLALRESEESLQRFKEMWIPSEERYFSETELKYKCEIYYKTSV